MKMINIYNLNLDAEPLENLADLTKKLKAAAESVNNLARYADARRTAAEFRLAGQIQMATEIERFIERFMESLYEHLPAELRW